MEKCVLCRRFGDFWTRDDVASRLNALGHSGWVAARLSGQMFLDRLDAVWHDAVHR